MSGHFCEYIAAVEPDAAVRLRSGAAVRLPPGPSVQAQLDSLD